MPIICVMEGVREHGEGEPVELWREERTARLVVRAYNEGGFAAVDIDLGDLVVFLARLAPGGVDETVVIAAASATEHRNRR